MNISKKLLSLSFILILVFTLTSCKKKQEYQEISVNGPNNNKIVNNTSYFIDNKDINITFRSSQIYETYVLIQEIKNDKVVKEDTLKIEDNTKPLNYVIKDIPKDKFNTYKVYTDIEIKDDKAKPKEEAKPNLIFALKNSPEEQKALQEKQELQGFNNKYELYAHQLFGKDTKVEVMKNIDENGKEFVQRVNIYTVDTVLFKPKGTADRFIVNSAEYIKKLRDNNLDYKSLFFIVKAEKVDSYGNSQLVPLAKMEVSKETADKINFENFNQINLKDIADMYSESSDIQR